MNIRFGVSLCLSLSLLSLAACTQPAVQEPSVKTVEPSSTPGASVNTAEETTQQQTNTSDEKVEQELIALLESVVPGIEVNTKVKDITKAHALQIANNPQDTVFKISQYDPVPPSNVEVLLQNQGLFVSDNLVTTFLSDGDTENLKTRFREQVQDVLGSIPFTHYGLSVVKKGPSWFVSTVLITQLVELNDMKTTYDEPLTLSFSGKVLRTDFNKKRLLVTQPDGRVVDFNLFSNDPSIPYNPAFQQSLDLSQKGLYSVEVEVQGELGPLPACNFVVAVGVPYPDTEEFAKDTQIISDVSQAQNELLDLINRDRAEIGVQALTLDEKLNMVSQSHSVDMVENKFVAHNSPTQGIPQAQAYQFKITHHVAQNIAVSRSLANSHRELMSSPGHRKTILDPSHTHVGFGIKAGNDGFLYITHNFINQFLKIEDMPAEIKTGETFTFKGTAPAEGAVGLFIKPKNRSGARLQFQADDLYEDDVLTVKTNIPFEQAIKIAEKGDYVLGIGYSAPPKEGENRLNFQFDNTWEMTVN